MTLTSKFLAVAVATTLLLGGCKGKDGDPGPAGAPAPVLTGSIVGFVAPLDENGQVLSKAGVLVTLANTSPQLAQTTDANGRYEFANVRSGTYNLVFSRADLALTRCLVSATSAATNLPSCRATTTATARRSLRPRR